MSTKTYAAVDDDDDEAYVPRLALSKHYYLRMKLTLSRWRHYSLQRQDLVAESGGLLLLLLSTVMARYVS